ncbi:MAG: ATP-dependent helicase HrpB [Blastocatellia bacterium]
MIALPIDALIPQILASFQSHPNLIIEATPGAGKTTRVPPALLAPEVADRKEVWVLEPRRIAARLSARRVAEELGERLGETVGYQVRFEEVGGPRTRLRFLTEGVLTRRLLHNTTLNGVAAVVLDEFHERHLQTDIALALLSHLQQTTRPDLKIIVMSATLDATPLARYLGDCPVLRCEGRRFEAIVTYQKEYDARPLAEQVASAARKVLATQSEGDVLVFLPGAAEIKRAQSACTDLAAQANLLLLPLHGELSTNEQEAAILPARQRKLILSTNVAETSITIDGVAAVIDSGLARIAEHSPWSGLPTLNIQRISQAAATQRAGRAGRTQAGVCWRLYTEMDFAARAAFETPEIHRLDLADTLLELHAFHRNDLLHLAWYEPPPTPALAAAEMLLQKLGAINRSGEITDLGEQMARYPLHPRQSRIFLEAVKRGLPLRGATVASLISERDLHSRSFASRSVKISPTYKTESDIFEQEALFARAADANFDFHRLNAEGINAGAAQAISRARQQILRLLRQPASDNAIEGAHADEQIRVSLLAGYPDRVARRQASDNKKGIGEAVISLSLANGSRIHLSPQSAVREATFLIGIDVEEKQEQRSTFSRVRTASAIEPDWLLDLFPDEVQELVSVEWNAVRERVEVLSQLCYDKLVLDESLLPSNHQDRAIQEKIYLALIEAVEKKGWQAFLDAETVARFLVRLNFVSDSFPDSGLPSLSEEDIHNFLLATCRGKRSFAELRDSLSTDNVFQSLLSYEQLSHLNRLAPERTNINGRKNVRINYEAGKPPWIASRLQDFFGMTATPTIGQGRVPLVLHLLAPNQRAVQVTSDLAGFWTRIYPQVRRELSRRYPKHAWPENPMASSTAQKYDY